MRYVDASGKATDKDSPQRLVWYSVGCGYWTDDWDSLKSTGPGIPCCPVCGCVGCQVVADSFLGKAVDDFERSGNPGYRKFLEENKGRCMRGTGGFIATYRRSIGGESTAGT